MPIQLQSLALDDASIRKLYSLQLSTLVTTAEDPKVALDRISRGASELLGAKSSGIYRHIPERGELRLVADWNRPRNIGLTLAEGEGIAGTLFKEKEPFITVPDYEESPYCASIYKGKQFFGSVLAVKLVWKECDIGVLYVDDECGRTFRPDEAELLQHFARHAATIIAFVELSKEQSNYRRRLSALAKSTSRIIGNHAGLAFADRLQLIAKELAEILDAETGSVFLVKEENFLCLEASFGHRQDHANIGRLYQIDRGSGLTGHIAVEGMLFNATYEELKNHPAVKSVFNDHSPSKVCNSILALPLFRKKGHSDELLGMLKATNKKCRDGCSYPKIGFTTEDEHIIHLFAEATTVALESAALFEEIWHKQEWLNRLVEVSPNGLISVDKKGRVLLFNSSAENILGYKAREVVAKKNVRELYWEPSIPENIGMELKVNSGEIRNYDTFVKNSDGQRIPVRLSALTLTDAKGNRIGSVGFFEDLRAFSQWHLFVEAIAHDLAEPLVNASGLLTEAIEQADKTQADSSITSLLSDALVSLDEMGEAIRQDLRMRRKSDLFDLVKTLKSQVEDFRIRESKVNIDLILPEMAGQLLLEGDERTLRKATANIIANACSFSPKGGVVTVELTLSEGSAIIIIEDEGLGVPMRLRELIFFETYSTRGRLGVGLAIAKKAVSSHGGSIVVNSRRDGKSGASFRLDIPLRAI